MDTPLRASARQAPNDAEDRVVDHDFESLVERLAPSATTRTAAAKAAAALLSASLTHEAAIPPELRREAGLGAWAERPLSELSFTPTLETVQAIRADDDTIRLVLRTRDDRLLEAVVIPGPRRTTLCISSQAGCARACAFCETGTLGLLRQLSTAEIIDQVRLARSYVEPDGAKPLRNVVFMGMGEPLDNLAAVARATRLLTDHRAFGLAPAHVTVSTVGVVDRFEEFFRTARAELAVSLNASTDAQRSHIMPIGKRFPLAAIQQSLLEHLPSSRRVLLSYALFHRFNDALDDADRLAAFARPLRARINVIPANPGPAHDLTTPPPETVNAFVARLAEHRMRVLVRRPRGRDVGGACGQLAGAARNLIGLRGP